MKAQNRISNSRILGNWVAKILSFLLAVFIVMAVRFLNVTDRVVHIPLDVRFAEESQYTPVSLVPDTIDVVITGDDAVVYLIDPARIKAYADFSNVTSEGIVRAPVTLVYDQDIYTENSLTVQARPSSVRILFEKMESSN